MRKQNNRRNNKGNYRGKSQYRPKTTPNSTSSVEEESLKEDSSKGPNDLSWYVASDQVLNDAARIPYNLPVGIAFARHTKVTPMSAVIPPSYDDAIPGLLASYVMPTLGNAKYPGDAVNVAANGVYQFVRSKISGSRNYNAVDMMIYLGAMDSIYYYVVWLTRLYGTIFTYHQDNRYLARALVEAQGVDYDDLAANLTNFRAQVNILLNKINALYLPSVMPLMQRHMWLFSHYYLEGDTLKDQIYFHIPAGIYYFDKDSDGAGMLRAHRMPANVGQLKVVNLVQALNSMIDPIFDDEDFNRISGDMLKAYEGKVMTVTSIPDIATVEFMHNEEVLLQFKNAKYKYVRNNAAGEFEGDFFNYVQDSNKRYLKCITPADALNLYLFIDNTNNGGQAVTSLDTTLMKNTMSAILADWSKDTMLTSPHPDVTPGESMINTRLTLAFEMINDASAVTGITPSNMYFGSEWPIEYRLFTFHRNISTQNLTMFFRRYDSHMAIGYDANLHAQRLRSFILSQVPILAAFRYKPELTIVVEDGLDNKVYDDGRSIFETGNYALVSPTIVGGLHNAAILGEFKIPVISLGQ